MTFAKSEDAIFSHNPMLVTDVRQKYDDEINEDIYVITGWYQGVQGTYYMTSADYNMVSDLRKSGRYYKIASGDILKISKKKNYIKAIFHYGENKINGN